MTNDKKRTIRLDRLLVAGVVAVAATWAIAAAGQAHPRPPAVPAEIAVRPNRTLLNALTDAGVEVMSDCLRGECGLCAAKVLEVEGELDHRDVFLSDEQQREDETIITCVSRAVGGAITIDTGFRR